VSDSLARKQRERRLLQAFIELSGEHCEIVEEREAPDFLVRTGRGTVVGVEITELFVPDAGTGLALKAKESLGDRLIGAAREQYERRGGGPIHVSVGFSPQTDFAILNRDLVATALAEFLLAGDFSFERPTCWRQTYEDSTLPREIMFLNIRRVREQAMSHWVAPRAGWIEPLTEAVLQAAINDKSLKLAQYRRVASETWLILSASGGAPSQGFDRNPDIPWASIHSPFDRTFLLSLIDGKVWEVGPSDG
jgi:hypothetical protein